MRQWPLNGEVPGFYGNYLVADTWFGGDDGDFRVDDPVFRVLADCAPSKKPLG